MQKPWTKSCIENWVSRHMRCVIHQTKPRLILGMQSWLKIQELIIVIHYIVKSQMILIGINKLFDKVQHTCMILKLLGIKGFFFSQIKVHHSYAKHLFKWCLKFSPQDQDFPGGSAVKKPPRRRYRRRRLHPWVETTPWKGKWQPAPVFVPGKCHGQRRLGSPRAIRSIGSRKNRTRLRDQATAMPAATTFTE